MTYLLKSLVFFSRIAPHHIHYYLFKRTNLDQRSVLFFIVTIWRSVPSSLSRADCILRYWSKESGSKVSYPSIISSWENTRWNSSQKALSSWNSDHSSMSGVNPFSMIVSCLNHIPIFASYISILDRLIISFCSRKVRRCTEVLDSGNLISGRTCFDYCVLV